MLSNFLVHEVKSQYLENPTKFNKTENIFEDDDEEVEKRNNSEAADPFNPIVWSDYIYIFIFIQLNI